MRPLILALALVFASAGSATAASKPPLWPGSDQSLKRAKYVDLTHTLKPKIPVWPGFDPATFSPTVKPGTTTPYTYATDGFEATHYDLPTDQFGTQLDPPAHGAPEYPSIDELAATYAVRPLVGVLHG